jgi:hypothetical protein
LHREVRLACRACAQLRRFELRNWDRAGCNH